MLPRDTPAVTASDPPHGARLHAVDALRAGAMLLGVYLHAALAYMHTPHGVSPVVDRSQSYFFDVTVSGIHGFRMQLFYVVAGFFAVMLISRRGVRGFLSNRLQRVGVPLVGAAVIVCPVVAWTFIAGKMLTGDNPAEVGPWTALADAARSGYWIAGYAIPMHLWFLWYLAAMCVLLAAAVRAGGRFAAPVRALATRVFGWTRSVRGFVLLCLLATAATVPMGGWMIETPANWLLSPATLIYYGLFFAAGALLYHAAAGDLNGIGHRWRTLLGVGAAAYVVLAVVGGVLTPPLVRAAGTSPIAVELANLPAASVQAVFTWSMILACFGITLRNLSHPGIRTQAVVRYLSDASYWIYLLHLPVVYLLQVLLYPWAANGFLKVGVILVITSAVSLLTYQTMVRHTIVGRVLNGSGQRQSRT